MNERLQKIISNQLTVPVVTGLVSLATGIGIGYILGKKKREEFYVVSEEQMTLDFTPEFKQTWANIQETVPEEPVKEVISEEEIVIGETFVEKILAKESETIEEEIVTHNVFAGADDEWDYEKELVSRDSSQPYILHKDEFYADELGLTQQTLTYYAGDNIMADEDDKPLYNHGNIVGELKFGHGSGDPNVFYVRNTKLKAEYEILFDEGLFSVEVLGLEIEDNARVTDLKHSTHYRKFRTAD